MNKRVLLIATVQSHIGQFHKPLMKLLKDNGWEIHVAARDNLAEKNGLQLEYPDKVFNIPFQRSPFDKRNYSAFRMLKQLLNREHYDVIHCNTPVGGILGRLAGSKYRKKGTEVYYTAHGFHFYKGAPKQNWLVYYTIEKYMAYFTDKLITITQEDYTLAKKRFHCDVYRMHGVGVDEKRFFPVSKSVKDQLKDKMGFTGPVILNIGELLPNKNQKMAIMMMKEVIKEYPTAMLLIAGNGPEEYRLKNLITESGLEQNVRLIGYCTNLEDYQHIADISVACSLREGLPLNIVESMLSETFVVASNNRGHRELIEDGVTGFIVNNSDEMAQRVCMVLRGRDTLMLSKAREKGIQYSCKSVNEELLSIYELNRGQYNG